MLQSGTVPAPGGINGVLDTVKTAKNKNRSRRKTTHKLGVSRYYRSDTVDWIQVHPLTAACLKRSLSYRPVGFFDSREKLLLLALLDRVVRDLDDGKRAPKRKNALKYRLASRRYLLIDPPNPDGFTFMAVCNWLEIEPYAFIDALKDLELL